MNCSTLGGATLVAAGDLTLAPFFLMLKVVRQFWLQNSFMTPLASGDRMTSWGRSINLETGNRVEISARVWKYDWCDSKTACVCVDRIFILIRKPSDGWWTWTFSSCFFPIFTLDSSGRPWRVLQRWETPSGRWWCRRSLASPSSGKPSALWWGSCCSGSRTCAARRGWRQAPGAGWMASRRRPSRSSSPPVE